MRNGSSPGFIASISPPGPRLRSGADEMVRGHEAPFVTDIDDVIPIDPRDTRLVRDSSQGFQRAKLFLEAQLRQMPLTAAHPDVDGIGAFRPLPYQVKAVEKAVTRRSGWENGTACLSRTTPPPRQG